MNKPDNNQIRLEDIDGKNLHNNIINTKEEISTSNKHDIEKINKTHKYGDEIKINKGDLLEYQIKRLLFNMGYFCKIGVIVRTSDSTDAEDVTDLDVFGIAIQKDFTYKSIWADCKAGKAKPLERISWINGIKNFIGIDDAIFVKKNVRINTKIFAQKSNIQILDTKDLNKLENDYCINNNLYEGSCNYKIEKKSEEILKNFKIDSNDSIRKILKFTKVGYWTLNEYTKVKKCITAIKQLKQFLDYPITKEERLAIKWLLYEVILLFVLATLKICRNTYYFSENDRNKIIEDGISSGEISDKKMDEILMASYKMAYSVIKSHIPNYNGSFSIPKVNNRPPVYIKEYIDLIKRITGNPLQYNDIMRYLDFMLKEYGLEKKEPDFEKINKYFINYKELNISFKTIIHFICSISGLSIDTFNLLV